MTPILPTKMPEPDPVSIGKDGRIIAGHPEQALQEFRSDAYMYIGTSVLLLAIILMTFEKPISTLMWVYISAYVLAILVSAVLLRSKNIERSLKLLKTIACIFLCQFFVAIILADPVLAIISTAVIFQDYLVVGFGGAGVRKLRSIGVVSSSNIFLAKVRYVPLDPSAPPDKIQQEVDARDNLYKEAREMLAHYTDNPEPLSAPGVSSEEMEKRRAQIKRLQDAVDKLPR